MPFQFQPNPGYLLVTTKLDYIDDRNMVELDKKLKERNDQFPLVIFDFSPVLDIHPQALRTLSRLLSGYSQNDVKTAFVVKAAVAKFISNSGMDRIIRCYASITEIIPNTSSQTGDKTKTLEFLNTALDAAVFTFKVATNTVVNHKKPFMRDKDNVPQHDVAAMVGLFSAHFHGTLILAFPAGTYLPIMNRLTGGSFNELTPEVRDGVAELLNIILGQAKTNLNQKGFQIKQAIPTLLQGGVFSAAGSSVARSVIIPFECDAGSFFIELTTNSDNVNGEAA